MAAGRRKLGIIWFVCVVITLLLSYVAQRALTSNAEDGGVASNSVPSDATPSRAPETLELYNTPSEEHSPRIAREGENLVRVALHRLDGQVSFTSSGSLYVETLPSPDSSVQAEVRRLKVEVHHGECTFPPDAVSIRAKLYARLDSTWAVGMINPPAEQQQAAADIIVVTEVPHVQMRVRDCASTWVVMPTRVCMAREIEESLYVVPTVTAIELEFRANKGVVEVSVPPWTEYPIELFVLAPGYAWARQTISDPGATNEVCVNAGSDLIVNVEDSIGYDSLCLVVASSVEPGQPLYRAKLAPKQAVVELSDVPSGQYVIMLVRCGGVRDERVSAVVMCEVTGVGTKEVAVKTNDPAGTSRVHVRINVPSTWASDSVELVGYPCDMKSISENGEAVSARKVGGAGAVVEFVGEVMVATPEGCLSVKPFGLRMHYSELSLGAPFVIDVPPPVDIDVVVLQQHAEMPWVEGDSAMLLWYAGEPKLGPLQVQMPEGERWRFKARVPAGVVHFRVHGSGGRVVEKAYNVEQGATNVEIEMPG